MNAYVYKSKCIYVLCVYIGAFVGVYTFTTYQGNYCRLLLGCICLPFSPLSLCILSRCSDIVARQKSSLLFTESKLIP